MENDSSKLETDLENGDDFLNDIIESNREMDNLLLESDFALETAESELKATIKNVSSAISEDDETSSALSIEVSDDLFKGFTSDINFSPLRYSSDNKDSKFKDRKIPENLNNLLDDFNATLKSYNNSVFQQDNNDNDKTLISDVQYDQGNAESSDINKMVTIKPLITFDSEEEHDYLYVDIYNTTLEITVPNSVDENLNHSPIATTLKHQNHFEGSSGEFDFKNIGNEFTVIVNTEKNSSNTEKNTCEPIKTDSDDNVVPEELNNDFLEKISEQIKTDNEYTSDDNDTIQNVVPEVINNDVVGHVTESIKTGNESTNDDNITSQNVVPEKENITEAVKTVNDFTSDDRHISFDYIELKQNDNVHKTSGISEVNSEITTTDMSLTFRNFIQSELNEAINITIEEQSLSNNAENDIKYNTLEIKETDTVESKVVEEITLNENNNVVVVPQTLKRPAEDIPPYDNKSKKQKLNVKPATVTKETTSKTGKTNDDLISSKTDEIIILHDDPTSSTADINFTQAIFVDHEETADNNDPKWSVLKDLETNEDYFKSVRTQWRSLSLPNPHQSNTTRYVPENIAKNKPHTATSSENERVTSCGQFLEKRIQNMSTEISGLYSKLNRLPRFKGRSERNRINNDLEHLRNLQHEVEKNKEELKHINMFYYNDSQGWNANYLTKPELTELEEQEQVLKFQKNFYK